VADAVITIAQLNELIASLGGIINESGRSVTPSAAQPIASSIARAFFESVRTELTAAAPRAGLVVELDDAMQELLRLATAPRSKVAYSGLKGLSALLLEATICIMKAKGEHRLVLSQTEKAILDKLSTILPPTADSYEQALADIAEGGRVSWRGTANELREVLREVIHHLAPTDAVVAAAGFALEDKQTTPTQRQRVRFILTSRHAPAAALDVVGAALTTVDETVAVLARITYGRSNASTHAGTGVTEIRNLKRYIDAVLAELLAVS
jgi:hypothetical protein